MFAKLHSTTRRIIIAIIVYLVSAAIALEVEQVLHERQHEEFQRRFWEAWQHLEQVRRAQ